MLRQGSIVRAWVSDPQGRNPKLRPLVVITPSQDIPGCKVLVGAPITGQFSIPVAKDEIALPYHPGGRASSALRKPCVAKCSWLVTLRPEDIAEQKGFLSSERLLSVPKAVADLEGKPADPV